MVVCVVTVIVVMVLYMGDGHVPKKNSVKLTVVALPARNVSMSL